MSEIVNKREKHYCLILLAVMFFVSCTPKVQDDRVRVFSFPAESGNIANGVSAAYAGLAENHLFFMGGCNFPDVPASEGGVKEFYKTIYCAPLPTDNDTILQWKRVGEIDNSSAYGVSVSMLGGIVIVGGTNGKKSLKTADILTFDADSMEVTINPLPDLPVALDNMGGAATDTMIYIAGGNANGVPSNRVFLLDFTNLQQEWVELPPFPGNHRIQPVCVVMKNPEGELSFYIFGGFSASVDGNAPSVSPNGYEYSFRRGTWREVSAPNINAEEIFLGGGAVAKINDTLAVFAGGVNKDIFLSALQREAKMKQAVEQKDADMQEQLKHQAKDYMTQSPEWYKFNDKVVIYNSLRNKWEEIVVTPLTARAGASLIHNNGVLYSIGGELKPGIRVAEVVAVELQSY